MIWLNYILFSRVFIFLPFVNSTEVPLKQDFHLLQWSGKQIRPFFMAIPDKERHSVCLFDPMQLRDNSELFCLFVHSLVFHAKQNSFFWIMFDTI